MIVLTLLIFSLITFVAVPMATYACAATLMRPGAGERVPLALLTMPVAPLVLSLILMSVYSLPLHSSPGVNIFSVLVPTLIALYTGRHHISELWSEWSSNKPSGQPFTALEYILSLLLLAILIQIVSLPMLENDALEYMAVAKRIFEAQSLSVYPTIDAPSGLFAPSSHPPAYHLFIVWGYSWLGSSNFAPARLLAVFNLIGTAALFARGLWGGRRDSWLLGMLLLLCAPLYVGVLVGFHIDALRLNAFLAAAIAMSQVIDQPKTRPAVLAGVILGLAAFAHSIGILAWAFAGIAWLLLGPADRFRNFRIPIIFGAFAVLVGGPQFIKNMLVYGVPLQDSAPVLEMPEINFATDLKYRRDLVILFDRFFFGALRGFTEPTLFGFSFWFGFAAVWLVWRDRFRATTIELLAASWILLFFAIAALTAVLGVDLVIKNSRYTLTILLLAVLLSAYRLTDLLPQAKWPRRGLAAFLIFLASGTLLQSAVRTIKFGANIDLAITGERAPIYRADNAFPGAPLYRHIEQNRMPGEKTLVFRQSDFTLYGSGDWIDNFDSVMMPFYRLKTVADAHLWLRAQNIRFVMVPDYTAPTYYRTTVAPLLSDPGYASIVDTHLGTRLFRLHDTPQISERACEPESMMPVNLTPWRARKSIFDKVLSLGGITVGNAGAFQKIKESSSESWYKSSINKPNFRISSRYGAQLRIMTGSGPLNYEPNERSLRFSGTPELVQAHLDAKGKGFLTLTLVEYLDNYRIVSSRIWDGLLDTENLTHIPLQFKVSEKTRSIRILIEKTGRVASDFSVASLKMCRRPLNAPSRAAPSQDPVPKVLTDEWQTNTMIVGCEKQWSGHCTVPEAIDLIREDGENGFRVPGEIYRISSPGFQPGFFGFYMRAYIEGWRFYLERIADPRWAIYVRPGFDYLTHSASDAPLVRHQLEFDASGDGEMRAYIQYSTPSGKTDWRFAGGFFLDESRSTIKLDFKLPADAVNHEIVLTGSAATVTMGKIRLSRIE